jgi:hypothetical protein
MAGTDACEGGDCPMKKACEAGVTACNDGKGCETDAKQDCPSAAGTKASSDCGGCESAAPEATQASQEDCVMAGTDACEGGDCPMKEACEAGVTACNDGKGCEADAKQDNAATTKALLTEATADCEGCSADGMCSDCDNAEATTASMESTGCCKEAAATASCEEKPQG